MDGVKGWMSNLQQLACFLEHVCQIMLMICWHPRIRSLIITIYMEASKVIRDGTEGIVIFHSWVQVYDPWAKTLRRTIRFQRIDFYNNKDWILKHNVYVAMFSEVNARTSYYLVFHLKKTTDFLQWSTQIIEFDNYVLQSKQCSKESWRYFSTSLFKKFWSPIT